MKDEIELMMPVKAVPYDHQKEAFAFAMTIFGVLEEGGDAYANDNYSLRSMRKEVYEAGNQKA